MRRLRKLRPRRAGAVQCLSPGRPPAPSTDRADPPPPAPPRARRGGGQAAPARQHRCAKQTMELLSTLAGSLILVAGSAWWVFRKYPAPQPFLAAGAEPDG